MRSCEALSPDGYLDFKHPNRVGRAWFSDELVDLMLRDEGITPPAREPGHPASIEHPLWAFEGGPYGDLPEPASAKGE